MTTPRTTSTHFKGSKVSYLLVHRDMINLFKSNSWTLLPPLDVIKTMWDLFEYNQSLSTTTLARRMFTQVSSNSESKRAQLI